MKARSGSGTASCLWPPHFPGAGKVKGDRSGADLQETKADLAPARRFPGYSSTEQWRVSECGSQQEELGAAAPLASKNAQQSRGVCHEERAGTEGGAFDGGPPVHWPVTATALIHKRRLPCGVSRSGRTVKPAGWPGKDRRPLGFFLSSAIRANGCSNGDLTN